MLGRILIEQITKSIEARNKVRAQFAKARIFCFQIKKLQSVTMRTTNVFRPKNIILPHEQLSA